MVTNDLSAYARFGTLLFDRPAPHVLRITLNNPAQMNALDAAMHHDLHHVWKTVETDPLTRVTIVTGAGRTFCAGGSLDAMPTDVEPDDTTPPPVIAGRTVFTG